MEYCDVLKRQSILKNWPEYYSDLHVREVILYASWGVGQRAYPKAKDYLHCISPLNNLYKYYQINEEKKAFYQSIVWLILARTVGKKLLINNIKEAIKTNMEKIGYHEQDLDSDFRRI